MTDRAPPPPTGGRPSPGPAAPRPGHGVLVRARNGDVIRYDPTGLVMRLSDKVIADIALRLSLPATEAAPAATPVTLDAEEHLPGIDAWDLRAEGEWIGFTARLPGRQEARRFRRLRAGGDILADAPGPLMAVLGLGGPRAALADPGPPGYPQHITGPADDIGAVGMAGVEDAPVTSALGHLRETTLEARVAEAFLDWQFQRFAPLPLFVARAETDSAATAAALAEGAAAGNLATAAANAARAALRMGKRLRVMGVVLTFGPEDLSGDATAYRDGMIAVMDRVTRDLAALSLPPPVFVLCAEGGLIPGTAPHLAAAQGELAWNHGPHRLIVSAPGYMFARDGWDRLTPEGRRELAEMTAAALSAPDTWRCPQVHLAERVAGDPLTLRLTLQADGPLVLDGPAEAHGFALAHCTNGAAISGVEIAPDDPQTILLRCDRRPEGEGLRVTLAQATGDAPARSIVRDGWALTSATGRVLRRWALPCDLRLREGGFADAPV